jgi:hypothetical protein
MVHKSAVAAQFFNKNAVSQALCAEQVTLGLREPHLQICVLSLHQTSRVATVAPHANHRAWDVLIKALGCRNLKRSGEL